MTRPVDTRSVEVRPPALVEAAAGTGAMAASAARVRADLGGSLRRADAFGAAAPAFRRFVGRWQDELERLVGAGHALALAVDGAAGDYARTDAHALAAGR